MSEYILHEVKEAWAENDYNRLVECAKEALDTIEQQAAEIGRLREVILQYIENDRDAWGEAKVRDLANLPGDSHYVSVFIKALTEKPG